MIGVLEHVVFFHAVGNFIIPTRFHIFQRVGITPTRNDLFNSDFM